jgi:hypothetical protein
VTPPSLRHIEASLGRTTERLAAELAAPRPSAPDWSAEDWRIARAAAAMHGVAPLLSRKLLWSGPPDWREFLSAQHAETHARHARLDGLARSIDARARAAGIALVGLKGLALHARGIYRAGERPMADIDLLVRPPEAALTAGLIEALGFQQSYVTWKHSVFEPREPSAAAAFGESSRNGLKIELHTHLGEQLPLRPVELGDVAFPRIPRPGLNDYRSSAALMSHLLLHAAGVMVLRELRLLQLYDIAQLAARMRGTDWEELLRAGTSEPATLWWAFPPLSLAARYFPAIPLDVLEALASRCPARLRSASRRRRLTEVSFSYLWVSAFPGIEWSRTLAEAADYIGRRLVPRPQVLSMRKTLLARQAALRESTWARMPQAQRVVRFLLSRPPRPDCMHNVRHALEQP